jgi:hypothetical protein
MSSAVLGLHLPGAPKTNIYNVWQWTYGLVIITGKKIRKNTNIATGHGLDVLGLIPHNV